MPSQAKTPVEESEDYWRGHRDGETAGYIRGRINKDEYERIDNKYKQLNAAIFEFDQTDEFDKTQAFDDTQEFEFEETA